MKFVIIHGSFGYPEENWIPQLKESLLALGQEVIVPKFPCDKYEDISKAGKNKQSKYQNLSNWMKVFKSEVLPEIKDSEICFVGHSISPLFILHVVNKYDDLNIDSAIFVSPFLRSLNREDLWEFEVVNSSFYKTDFDFDKLKKSIPESYVLYSEDDPYVSTDLFKEFGEKMDSSLIRVKKAGHLGSSINNEFSLVYELCKSRLDLDLYQKYVAHRRELYGVDYIKASEEVIYLKPADIFDEGVFKFRNLKKHGFCTLLTSMKIWDTQSIYMQSCRNAAKRIGNMVRVFIVDKIEDLERKKLKEQLILDIKSDVKVYFVMKKEVEDIAENLDFGLWDYEYLCLVRDDDGEAMLSSRKKDIDKGKLWEKKIIERSFRVRNIDKDLREFIDKNR